MNDRRDHMRVLAFKFLMMSDAAEYLESSLRRCCKNVYRSAGVSGYALDQAVGFSFVRPEVSYVSYIVYYTRAYRTTATLLKVSREGYGAASCRMFEFMPDHVLSVWVDLD